MRGMIVEDIISSKENNDCEHWLGATLSEYDSADMIVLQDLIDDSDLYAEFLFDYCPKCGSKIIWKTNGEHKFTEK